MTIYAYIIAKRMFYQSALVCTLTASKHLPLAICCQHGVSVYRWRNRDCGVVDANGGDGITALSAGRGGGGGSSSAPPKSLTWPAPRGLTWF
ncbi:hypothetical protein KCP73_05820 [Salmonella enterica subsp. enterica]|nr:hypothetical protein KCP73_05820 [Salmonella enterica subsp. enterica]